MFSFHESSALDCDWLTDDMFVSCSTDKKLIIAKVGEKRPLRTLKVSIDTRDKGSLPLYWKR